MNIDQYIGKDGYAKLPKDVADSIDEYFGTVTPEGEALKQAIRTHNNKLADERAAAYQYDMNVLVQREGANYPNHPEFWAIEQHQNAIKAERDAKLAQRAPMVLAKPRSEWEVDDWEVLVAAGLAHHEYDDRREEVIIRYRLNDDVQQKIQDGIDDLPEEGLAKLGL